LSFADHEYLPFLALVLALFQFVPGALRGLFLLAASAVFYLWWQPWHGLVLAAVIAADYAAGLGLARSRGTAARRAWLALALLVNLGLLASFKYSGFLVGNLNALLAALGAATLPVPEPSLPLGLSFYAFQGLGYVVDVARGRLEACRDPLRFALYVSFFPQLVAGPIERARELLPQLARLRRLDGERALSGGALVLWGVFKKWVLADHLSQRLGPVFERAGESDPLTLAVTAAALYVVLYLDFSAYTDLARGSARLFGVELSLNFRLPLAARSTAELAQRWHITLYTWIRDYAFAPFARGPIGYASIWRSSLVVLGLFGLWHGASWRFVVWGLASGVVIAVQHSWRLARTRAGVRRAPRAGWGAADWAGWGATQVTAALFIVLFFAPDLRSALAYYARLFDPGALRLPTGEVLALAGALAALYLGQVAVERAGPGRLEAAWGARPALLRLALLAGLAAATVLLRVPEPLPFVYFQF